MTAESPFKQPETIEKNGIEIEDKEVGFIGPRLPRVMTNEEEKQCSDNCFQTPTSINRL